MSQFLDTNKIDNTDQIETRHFISLLHKDNSLNLLSLILTVFDIYYEAFSKIIEKAGLNIDQIDYLNQDGVNEDLLNLCNEILHAIEKLNFRDINKFFEFIQRIFMSNSIITIGIEQDYIDREFRDSYYFHYSERHLELERYCIRLVFFQNNQVEILSNQFTDEKINILQNNIIGSMVIRPIINCSIGRTLINPRFLLNGSNAYLRTSLYNIYYLGIKFKIRAFPYLMQDNITTSCAEVTLLNILDYYSNQYSDYKFSVPSNIHNLVKQEHFDRVIPTTGLSYQTMSRILCKMGFYPKLYICGSNMSKNEIKNILSYYVESGMPIAIGLKEDTSMITPGHSVICIGHGECNFDLKYEKVCHTDNLKTPYINSVKSYFTYMIQDDTQFPYAIANFIGENTIQYKNENKRQMNITCMIAPLYKRMYMDAQKAENTILKILDKKDFSPLENSKLSYNDKNPIIFRLFLASSRHLKQARINNIKNEWVVNLYQEIPLPQFVWVCELYDKQGYKRNMAFGEIILDATYAGQDLIDSCLLINYPNKQLAQNMYKQSIFLDDQNLPYNSFDWITIPEQYCNCEYPAYNYNLRPANSIQNE